MEKKSFPSSESNGHSFRFSAFLFSKEELRELGILRRSNQREGDEMNDTQHQQR